MEFFKVLINDEENIKRLSALATKIIRAYYDPILGKAQNDYMLEKFQSQRAISEQLEAGYSYYIVKDGEDLGFIGFYKKEDYMYLSKLYLSEEARGKGYGRKMLDFVKKQAQAQGLNSIVLNVNKYNLTIEIYKKLGFEIIRAEKNDIGNGYFMDDYVMKYNFG